MKRILLLALALVSSMTLFAENHKVVKINTPAMRDSSGKRVYQLAQSPEVYKRKAFSISYGTMAVTSFNWYANDVFKSRTELDKQYSGTLSGQKDYNIGTIAISYGYEFTPWCEFYVPVLISYTSGKLYQDMPSGDGYGEGPYNDLWVAIMPSVRFNWIRTPKISLYSRVGVGLGLANRYESFTTAMNTKVSFAWHLSPIGAEFGGKNTCFFIEAGYGYAGLISMGAKFKIKAGVGQHKEWYEKYIH